MIRRTLRIMSSSTKSPRVVRTATPQLRLSAVVRQMSATSSSAPTTKTSSAMVVDGPSGTGKPSAKNESPPQPPVLFRSESNSSTFILNRPDQLNALDQPMLELLKTAIEEWETSPRCQIIIGTGNGRAFCAGGDVKSIVKSLIQGNPEMGITFFKEEFELDYALASLKTPYVAILDGMTMGGGVGLSINAMFRVATEHTVFAMPETKIGYSPDVGASFFLPRLDGALGTYLGLTGESLRGREVFEAGIATHFVESHRIPALLDRLNNLELPTTAESINDAIEEFYSDRSAQDGPSPSASRRMAVDKAFSGNTVEKILDALQEIAAEASHPEAIWAQKMVGILEERSPTSLRVAHELLRRGRGSTLEQALTLELGIATAYCSGASPDFVTGVKALLMDKLKGRPNWSPNKLADIPLGPVLADFFQPDSRYMAAVPHAAFHGGTGAGDGGVVDGTGAKPKDPMRFCLPSEAEIGRLVRGEHPSSSSTAFFSVEELVAKVQGLTKKRGVPERVADVVARRCELVPKSGMQEAHLRWIH